MCDMRIALRASGVALAMSLLLTQPAGATATPSGGIHWGPQHGTAVVHQAVEFNPPSIPAGATMDFHWKIGNTYTKEFQNIYLLPWRSVGHYVYGIVKVHEHGVTYWHAYRFGPVRA